MLEQDVLNLFEREFQKNYACISCKKPITIIRVFAFMNLWDRTKKDVIVKLHCKHCKKRQDLKFNYEKIAQGAERVQNGK